MSHFTVLAAVALPGQLDAALSQVVEKFIAELSESTVLVPVDCHI